MLSYENKYWDMYAHVAGVDEAGRGCWAGPVVSSAVILPRGVSGLEMVNDSKKLSPKQRELCLEIIQKKALAIGVGIVDSQKIDEINILEATKVSMIMALNQMMIQPEFVLIDGNARLNIQIPQHTIIDGDALSLSIASASIVAKVTRDRLMHELSQNYPGYGFEQHKGYGTAIHRKALQNLGPTPIHRMSYKPLKELVK